MNIYEKRWNAAKDFALKIKNKAIEEGATHFDFDKEGLHIPIEDFVITEKSIEIKGKIINIMLFENDKELDHGLYDSIKDTKNMLLDTLEFFKKIEIKLK